QPRRLEAKDSVRSHCRVSSGPKLEPGERRGDLAPSTNVWTPEEKAAIRAKAKPISFARLDYGHTPIVLSPELERKWEQLRRGLERLGQLVTEGLEEKPRCKKSSSLE